MTLLELGWCDVFEASFRPHAECGLVPARVCAQHRGGYRLLAEDRELAAEVSGRFRHQTFSASDYPVVGDWVAVVLPSAEERGMIQAVLPRRTRFSRKTTGDATEEQTLAANLDEVFIVESLATPINVRRIERYLALAWQSGANPIVLLTKSDLCEDLDGELKKAGVLASSVPVHPICSLTGQGVDTVLQHLRPASTAALLGPSGVGKSTFINHLVGEERQWVQPTREDDQKGRHTTTHREMVRLPNGGFIIDTPGLRELQLWEGTEGVEVSFDDIEELACECRFTDCRHQREPGCAVLLAVEEGSLDAGRLESFQKLAREAEHFERRQDARAQADERRRWRSIARGLRAHKKHKDKP